MRSSFLQHGSYVTTPVETAEETYIGDWCVSSSIIYHRHPDEIEEDICGETGVVEHDVNDKKCWACATICSDEIWLIHMLYQL